jgi:uncharacterized protein with NAD-binding domain and iron-sulfur cluster
VLLAGDYTDPDYPPTLEAAVRSGMRAALKVAQQLDRLVDALHGDDFQPVDLSPGKI